MSLTRTMNVYDVDLKDRRRDHQLFLVLNGPIWKVMELV